MCTYYYLHYHHAHPCTRDITYSLQYDFCEHSTLVRLVPSPSSSTSSPPSSRAHHHQSHHHARRHHHAPPASTSSSNNTTSSPLSSTELFATEYVQQPCASLLYAAEYSLSGSGDMGMDTGVVDYGTSSPCGTSGCLMSAGCSMGSCRLEDLGGRWVCCQCCRGGNTFRWCAHPMRKVPDTMCYHVVCADCWADS